MCAYFCQQQTSEIVTHEECKIQEDYQTMEMQHEKESKETSGGVMANKDGTADLKPSETEIGMK